MINPDIKNINKKSYFDFVANFVFLKEFIVWQILFMVLYGRTYNHFITILKLKSCIKW